MSFRPFKALLIILSLFSGTELLFAADGTWTNIGGGNWSDANKWKDGIVAGGADSTAAISAGISVNTYVITNDGPRNIGTVIFSDTLNQDNTWTLSDGGVGTRILTMTNTTAVAPLIAGSNRTVNLDVPLAGSQGLTLQSEYNAASYGINLRRLNTYSGTTTIRKGAAVLGTNAPAGAPGAFGQDASAVQLGAIDTATEDDTAIRLALNVTCARDIQVNNVGSNATLGATSTGGTRTFSGNIQLNRSVLLGNAQNGPTVFSGLLKGSGGITVGGPNADDTLTVTLSNTNTFTGPVTISRGTLTVTTNVLAGENGALGNSTSAILLGDENTANYDVELSFQPGSPITRDIWVKDVGSSGSAILNQSANGTVLHQENIRIDRLLSILCTTANQNPIFSGNISGTGSVQLVQTGKLSMNGIHTFTGDMIHKIGSGTLIVGQDVAPGIAGPLGNSTNPVIFRNADANAHTLQFTNTLTFSRGLRVEEGVKTTLNILGGNLITTVSGPITFDGNLTLTSSDLSELVVSGRLVTRTNTLSLTGISSSGNNIRLSNTNNELSGAVSIGSGARLVAEKKGALKGATQILFPTTGANPTGLFLGEDATATQAVSMALSSFNGAVEIGTRASNGVCLFAGPVSLTRTNTQALVQFTAASNSTVRFTSPVTGFFYMRKLGDGAISFEDANSWTNETEIQRGTLRAVDGQGLPSLSHLLLNGILGGGVFESSGTFTRTLGIGPGQVSWTAGTSGHGGFSAKGGKLTVDLNNDGPTLLTWGSASYTPNFLYSATSRFRFGSTLADSEVEFIEPILVAANANIEVYDNPAVRTDKATLSGVLSGSASLTKFGAGALVLKATNTFTGIITIGTTALDGGTLMINGELPSSASALTINSNSWLGGSGTIRYKTVTMAPGSGFDWADDPGTLTITNSFAFPTNGVFRFVYGNGKTSKVVSGNKLTLPQNATIELVRLNGITPMSSVILSSANTVGAVTDWTIANNTLGFTLTKSGNDVILQYSPKGTLMIVR